MIGAWKIDPSRYGGGTTNGASCTSFTLGNPVHPLTQYTYTGTLTWNVRFSDGSTVIVDAADVIEARAQAENIAHWLPRIWGAPERQVIGVSEV